MSVQGSNRGGVGSDECLVARTQRSFAVFVGLTGGDIGVGLFVDCFFWSGGWFVDVAHLVWGNFPMSDSSFAILFSSASSREARLWFS